MEKQIRERILNSRRPSRFKEDRKSHDIKSPPKYTSICAAKKSILGKPRMQHRRSNTHLNVQGIFRERIMRMQKLQTVNKVKRTEGVFPMSPNQAVAYLGKNLEAHHKSEIQSYDRIYYIGNSLSSSDDAKGFFKLVQGSHIAYRFEVLKSLGKGSFGNVCKCWDHKKGEEVALKVIKNQKEYREQAMIEIEILEKLRSNDQPHIVRIKSYFIFRKHVIIVFELLGPSLYSFIKSKPCLDQIRRVATQLLKALCYIKEYQVVHCDLKPDNILFAGGELKLIDFGLACIEEQHIHTYVQSRYYRAPEIVFGSSYTTAIDMWSFGCIFAEMFTGVPLFPAKSEKELIKYHCYMLGLPPPRVLEEAKNKEGFCLNNGGVLKEYIHCEDKHFADLLKCCLDWDPTTRITPEEALLHPFITDTAKLTKKPHRRTNSIF